LPVSVEQVCLTRWIEVMESGDYIFHVGFSDELLLQVDEQIILAGTNTFSDSPHWSERGYVSMDKQVVQPLAPGLHKLTAALKAKEPFGFGLALRIEGGKHTILPAHLCGYGF